MGLREADHSAESHRGIQGGLKRSPGRAASLPCAERDPFEKLCSGTTGQENQAIDISQEVYNSHLAFLSRGWLPSSSCIILWR